MSNTNKISPQGYIITKDPKNDNPFWGGGDEPIDPSVYTRLDELENDVAELESDKADVSALTNFYTKSQVDEIIEALPQTDLANYYTKAQTEAKIDEKIAEIPPTDLSNYYTKAQVDEKIAESGTFDPTQYYTKTQTDNLLSTKANISAFNNYYNKTETDALIDGVSDEVDAVAGDLATLQGVVNGNTSDITSLQNAVALKASQADLSALTSRVADNETAISNLQSSRYTKTEVDTLLDAKANVVDVYNKTQIDAMIGDIQTILEGI